MAIDFPNSPTNGQTYTVGDTTWTYDGTKWNKNAVTLIGPTGPSVTGPTGPQGTWSLAQTVTTVTGPYTIATADAGKVILMNATADFTVTGPTAFSTGQSVDVIRIGTGACAVTGPAGTTVVGTPGLKLRAQYSAATILCVGSNTYYVIGDLSA